MVCRTTKRCPGCCPPDVELPVSHFGTNKARPDGLQAQCRDCLKRIQKDSRTKHAATERLRSNRVSALRRRLLRDRVLAYLKDHPCVDCGEADPVVLEFDHREGFVKDNDVARMVSDGMPWPVILAEIEKCDVRCANDHRRKTARERGAYRLTPSDVSVVA